MQVNGTLGDDMKLVGRLNVADTNRLRRGEITASQAFRIAAANTAGEKHALAAQMADARKWLRGS